MVPIIFDLAGAGSLHGQPGLPDRPGGSRGPFSQDRETPVREIYILASEQAKPPSVEVLRAALESEEARLTTGEGGSLFSVRTQETHIVVRFETKSSKAHWGLNNLTGSDESLAALRRARGFYRIAFAPGKPQPSVGVFEALWCARSMMEHIPGVLIDLTAFKVHDSEDVVEITDLEFDIRDHVNLHAVDLAHGGDSPLWIHSHGMEKFGLRDVEAFHLAQDDLMPAESFLYELCTDLAFGHAPAVRSAVGTSAGLSFMLVPSEEARNSLMGLPLETFEGHEGPFLTVVASDGRHTVAELLRPYRDRFEKETPEEAEALLEQVRHLLPAFKARFLRRGLMEPMTFLVRAPFETHPDGDAVQENLWLEVLAWDEERITGKLVDGAAQTTEWRKGASVEIDEDSVNAVAMGRDGRPLDEEEMQGVLLAERPS